MTEACESVDVKERAVARLAKRFDSSRLPVYAFDREGRRIYSNPQFDALVGYDGSEFIGRKPPFPFTVEPFQDVLDATLEERLTGLGVVAIRYTYQHRELGPVPCLIWGEKLVEESVQVGWLCVARPLDARTLERLGLTKQLEQSMRMADVAESLRTTVQALSSRVSEISRQIPAAEPTRPGAKAGLPSVLTAREREVAELLLQGYRVPDIARRLHLSVHTVRNHCKSMFRKLGVGSQSELVARLRDG